MSRPARRAARPSARMRSSSGARRGSESRPPRAARVRLDGFAQRTVTGAALSRLRALVDTQPVVAPGVYACPAGFAGQAIQVTFVDAHGRTLAKIAANSADGCRWLSVRVGSRRGPALLGGW